MVTLAAYLSQNSVSYEAFAAKLGVSAMSVSRWARGLNRPHWDTIQQIMQITGGQVTPDSFLKAEKSPSEAA